MRWSAIAARECDHRRKYRPRRLLRDLRDHDARTPDLYEIWVIHYCVPNIPSGFARTASHAISNVLMPLLLEGRGRRRIRELVWHKIHLRSGIYLFKGALTNFHLSQRFDLKYSDLNLLIASSALERSILSGNQLKRLRSCFFPLRYPINANNIAWDFEFGVFPYCSEKIL